MAFPEKNTRTIIVDGVKYLWHLNHNFDLRNSWIVVKREESNGQMLWIDPYCHDLLLTPNSVAQAIRFALNNDWNPDHKAHPLRLTYDQDAFEVVPEDSLGFDHKNKKDKERG
jgi:hypothetical protein